MFNLVNFILSQGCQGMPGATGGGTPTPGACGEGGFTSIIFIALIFVIFYFLFIRPSQLKQKEHQGMINSLKKGDRVVTQGGIHGKITQIKSNSLKLKVDNNTEIEIEKNMISKTREKGTEGE
ncbi:preprotein translocase subunit YajC [candidate division WOR-3 bacterium]|nr:preprotein translocase subunit YajC [candidate division WOR-3 bacterium]